MFNKLFRFSMHIRKKQNRLSVMEAVDNLSLLAELSMPKEKEKMEPEEFIEEQPEEHISKRSWYNLKDLSFNLEKAKGTFRILYNYLKNLYENEEQQLREPDIQKGIQAMMLLTMEAGGNLDRFLEELPERNVTEKVVDWPEYKELQQFYINIIVPKLQNRLELVEKWQEDWGIGAEDEELLAKRRGITDIEGVRHDADYELFFIRRDDGRPFFSRTLLRHIHLVEQFDELIVNSLDEDPLSRIHAIKDRDWHLSAREILHIAAPYIDEFYRMGMKHKDMDLVATMNKALMALMLAANPRNLLHTALGKSCFNYFADFQIFFRLLLSSKEYQRIVEHSPPSSERLAHCLINLSHVLSAAFFMRSPSIEDMRGLIRLLIEKGEEAEEIESPTHSPLSIWNVFLDEHAQICDTLKNSPYGPLHNAIEIFKEGSQLKGFDPIFHSNLPCFLYSAANDKISVGCLHIPCPIFQDSIKKALVIPEFHSFLRALSSGKRNQRHLVINLQDRTSWQEYARCVALEELSKKKEYEKALKVLTLATGTDFYIQSGVYLHLDDAKQFIQQFKEQLESGEECGFYFPEELTKEKLRPFNHMAMELIHDLFFGGKKTLVHKNRLDFIEIFYLFFILKCIEELEPDTISFTSKDSVDSGAAVSAEFFAFLKMMNTKEKWTEAEKDSLRLMFYCPALMVRARTIESQNLKRALSALSIIQAELEAHYRDVVSSSRKLFDAPFFTDLVLKEQKSA